MDQKLLGTCMAEPSIHMLSIIRAYEVYPIDFSINISPFACDLFGVVEYIE